MKTAQDSYTNTIKQIVRLQERMHFEKIQLDQVQNGRILKNFKSIKFKMAAYYSPRQASYCGISLKPLKIATPLL